MAFILRVLDEANTINGYVRKLKAEGVHTIIVMVHQGGYQQATTETSSPTSPLAGMSLANVALSSNSSA